MPTPAPHFDWTINVGNVLTLATILGAAWLHNYRRSIERTAADERQQEKLDTLTAQGEKTVEGLATLAATANTLTTSVGTLTGDVAALKAHSAETAQVMTALRETVSELKGDVGGLKTQGAATAQAMRDSRHETNEVSHRVTRLETQIEFVVNFLIGDPDIRNVAKGIAIQREKRQDISP